MKTALFLSPHLDDAAFSCGGTLARLAAENRQTILCTIFTKSVLRPRGFALACQLDKNLPAAADYMKIRRAEDERAAKILNVSKVLHLDFSEAPHRGYQSAPELFAGIKIGDEIWQSVAERLDLLDKIHRPELIFAPQGIGNHADHLQTMRAAREVFPAEKTFWYRDAPYAIRQPDAPRSGLLPPDDAKTFCDIEPYLEQKIRACVAYQSQINFQFGAAEKLKTQLREFHRQEADRLKINSSAIEIYSSKLPFSSFY